MKKISFLFVCLLLIAARVSAQDDLKAQEIIKKAKNAIGKESKLAELQSLSVSGTNRKMMGSRQIESVLSIEIVTPDKIKKVESNDFVIATDIVNGNEYWQDHAKGLGVGANVVVVMRGGGGEQDKSIRDQMLKMAKHELNLIFLTWFLSPLPALQTTYSYVGEAPAPNGKAWVIAAKTSDQISTRLFFDQETYQLIGVSYNGKPQLFSAAPGNVESSNKSKTEVQGAGQRTQLSDEEKQKLIKERMEAIKKAPEIEYKWAFDDFKNVGGLNLPHRITKLVDGKPTEEIEIIKVKINPKLSIDIFAKE